MPFGVKYEVWPFQRLSDQVLFNCMEFTQVYIDDIIVFRSNVQSHCGHHREVFKRLEQSGLELIASLVVLLRPCNGRW